MKINDRLHSRDAAINRDRIGDIEIGVFKCDDFVVARHSLREVATDKSGGAGYQYFSQRVSLKRAEKGIKPKIHFNRKMPET